MTDNGIQVTCPNCYAAGPYILVAGTTPEVAQRAALDQWDANENRANSIALAAFSFAGGLSAGVVMCQLFGVFLR